MAILFLQNSSDGIELLTAEDELLVCGKDPEEFVDYLANTYGTDYNKELLDDSNPSSKETVNNSGVFFNISNNDLEEIRERLIAKQREESPTYDAVLQNYKEEY